MLFAIEWIRTQLEIIYEHLSRFFNALTLDAIGAFLTKPVIFLVLFFVAGLALVIVGFRCHKLVSCLAGSAVMGFIGWHVGTAINFEFVTVAILWAFLLAGAGLFVFYYMYAINVFIGAFLVAFVWIRQLFPASMLAMLISAGLVTAIYCLLLMRHPAIRTPIAGGALLGLIAWHFFGGIVAGVVWAACIVSGILLQRKSYARFEEMKRLARNYKPNAPSPPSREEIVAEFAQEAEEKAARQKARQEAEEAAAREQARQEAEAPIAEDSIQQESEDEATGARTQETVADPGDLEMIKNRIYKGIK